MTEPTWQAKVNSRPLSQAAAIVLRRGNPKVLDPNRELALAVLPSLLPWESNPDLPANQEAVDAAKEVVASASQVQGYAKMLLNDLEASLNPEDLSGQSPAQACRLVQSRVAWKRHDALTPTTQD